MIMKLLVVSDLHGSLFYAKKIFEQFETGAYDSILFLGDIMYHGPRNPFPEDYSPKDVATLFNKYKDRVLAVRGNCDSEVDQMLLEFPMMSDYLILPFNERKVFVTHGHLFGPTNLPPLHPGDCLLFGHFHILYHQKEQGIHLLNPGSISLPKMDLPHTYGELDEHGFKIYTIDHTLLVDYPF